MGIFSKLFGRKKKEEQKKPVGEKAAKPSEPSDEVSLEDVNESLEEVNTIRKDEPKEEAPKKETPKAPPAQPETSTDEETKKTEEKPEETTETEEEKAVYDIKKHADGWQVIKEGADRAYRVFDYQKQAIDFAKEEGLEYRVFKADGTPRK